MQSPEARVTKQLVEALLYEELVPSSLGHGRRAVKNSQLAFSVGKRDYSCVATVSAFGRLRIDAESIVRKHGTKTRRAQWQDILSDLPMLQTTRDELFEELDNTVVFSRWNQKELPAYDRRSLSYEDLEGAIDEGHPYHPCFKARTGFTLEDHAAYGPEARGRFALRWLALRRSSLTTLLPMPDDLFWRRELGDATWNELCCRLAAKGCRWENAALLPVHPWQWSFLNRSAGGLAFEFIDLGMAGDEYSATQSLRTVMCVDKPSNAHLKLPLSTQVTSSRRDLQPPFLHSAPAISQWLQRLYTDDPYLRSRCRFLREYAAVAPREGDAIPTGKLGVLFRESVSGVVAADERAVPLNALTLIERDGLPFIDPWISEYGVTRWVQRLIEIYVLPVWHLLAQHGVALEAHAQNCILVHRSGWPQLILLRDFSESLEYATNFVAQPGLVPRFADLHPLYACAPDNRYHRMSDVTSLFELVTDCLFVFNLSDLSFLLQVYYGFAENLFWRIVRAQLDEYSRRGNCNTKRITRLPFAHSHLKSESIFARRLQHGPSPEIHHLVPNPLAQGES